MQAAAVAYDLPSSLTKLRHLVKDASSDGAHLAVFPEAFLSAYPRHLDFAIGARTAENRAWYTRYVESSVRIPDGAEGNDWLANQGEADLTEADEFWAFEQICRAARDSSIVSSSDRSSPRLCSALISASVQHISDGIIERSLVGATLWCTNILVSDRGVLLSELSPPPPCWRRAHSRRFRQASQADAYRRRAGCLGTEWCSQ